MTEFGKMSGDFGSAGISLSGIGSNKFKFEGGGSTREVWSMFNRETRNCHFCTSTITQNCKVKQKSGFLGIGASKTMECTSSDPVEKCEDIPL